MGVFGRLLVTAWVGIVCFLSSSSVRAAIEDLSEINDKLTEGVTVVETDPLDWFNQCVPPFRAAEFGSSIPYSNHFLKDEPAGLCSDFLSCAYERCLFSEDFTGPFFNDNFFLPLDVYEKLNDSDGTPPNPEQLNLPSHITFPKNAYDVVQLVNFAGSHCMKVSVKNGGHSYHGASNMKGSLQLNLRDLQKYSNSSIEMCDSDEPSPACQLAIANDKPAVVRVGGGELWDELYRAVFVDWNRDPANQDRKLDVVGGGAGTVSAIGGWMQGGGESIGDERMRGFGVDNVVELEMVLANGKHVKFGPTEYERVEGMLYSQTITVGGQCNLNVVPDESAWQWGDCEEAIPFDKLWKAVRGGGGGTYGIVTSGTYQLHEHMPLYSMLPNAEIAVPLVTACTIAGTCQNVTRAFARFFLDMFFDPAAIGMDEETSNSCGSPGFSFDVGSFVSLFCRNPDSVMEAWLGYVESLTSQFGEEVTGFMTEFFIPTLVSSYGEQNLIVEENPSFPVGKIADYPPPSTFPDVAVCWSVLVPIEFLKFKDEGIIDLVLGLPTSHVIGGKATVSSDSMNSIPAPQRRAGLQSCIFDRNLETIARESFKFFEPEPEEGMFPGGTEYNHISNILFGPLKSNWYAACPDELSFEESEEQCVSTVESVWGTKLLGELEAIKKEVDPNNMFKCYRCVGENIQGDCEIDGGSSTERCRRRLAK